MVILPAIIATLAAFFTVVAVTLIIMITSKVGLSILCKASKIKKWGFLWIPFVYGWFEGDIITRLAFKAPKADRIIQVVWTVFHCATYLGTLWFFVYYIPNVDLDAELDLSIVLLCAVAFTTLVFKAVMRVIAVFRNGRGIVPAILSVIFPPIWPYFMIKPSVKLAEGVSE